VEGSSSQRSVRRIKKVETGEQCCVKDGSDRSCNKMVPDNVHRGDALILGEGQTNRGFKLHAIYL
jgi:hypothetical protein